MLVDCYKKLIEKNKENIINIYKREFECKFFNQFHELEVLEFSQTMNGEIINLLIEKGKCVIITTINSFFKKEFKKEEVQEIYKTSKRAFFDLFFRVEDYYAIKGDKEKNRKPSWKIKLFGREILENNLKFEADGVIFDYNFGHNKKSLKESYNCIIEDLAKNKYSCLSDIFINKRINIIQSLHESKEKSKENRKKLLKDFLDSYVDGEKKLKQFEENAKKEFDSKRESFFNSLINNLKKIKTLYNCELHLRDNISGKTKEI